MLRILPVLALLAFFVGIPTLASAQSLNEATLQKGIHAVTFGAMTVIAVQDRPGEMDISLFSGPATEAERKALMPSGKAPASVNAFVIKNNGKIILIDAGYGDAVSGESYLVERLAALGITPTDVDTILLTHMHRDHIGGLLHSKKAVFPKASVLVALPEFEYWLSAEKEREAKAGTNPNALLALEVREAYGSSFATFIPGETLAPGILAVPAPGHTPGHTAYLLESGGMRLFIIGDLIHAAALQFPRPDECAKYDMNPAQAVETRKALLQRAALENIDIAGMHLPFPSMGKVSGTAEKGFQFMPDK